MKEDIIDNLPFSYTQACALSSRLMQERDDSANHVIRWLSEQLKEKIKAIEWEPSEGAIEILYEPEFEISEKVTKLVLNKFKACGWKVVYQSEDPWQSSVADYRDSDWVPRMFFSHIKP